MFALRHIIGGGAFFAIAACAGVASVDPAAPGQWFWFKVAGAEERVAYYSAQCDGNTACVTESLRRQALDTCRVEQLGDFRDEDPADRLEEMRKGRINCANRLLLPHGIRV